MNVSGLSYWKKSILRYRCFNIHFGMLKQMENKAILDRRKTPTPILSRYTIVGRRSRLRRKEDQEKGGYIDRYGNGLFIWVLLLFVLNIFDAAFTLIILDRGGHEVNPLIHWLIGTSGDHFISWKFAILSDSIIILCLHSKFRMVKPVFYFSTVIYSVVVLYQMILISSF
jgi:hypothetical protein